MKLISWNVNGLRACHRKGAFLPWLDSCGADVVGLQEVRAQTDALPREVRAPEGWWTHHLPAERKGYSGVALLARRPPDELETSLGVPEFDSEGRFQLARFGKLFVANVYFPNGSGRDRDNSRVPFKLAFYRHVYRMVSPVALEAGGAVVVMGDFNTAREPRDLARPSANTGTSGFLPEERLELDRWLDAGWLDSFRLVNGDGGNYTWWSNRPGVRERNVGWRIDACYLSPALRPLLADAAIHSDVHGSDHCPVSVELAVDMP